MRPILWRALGGAVWLSLLLSCAHVTHIPPQWQQWFLEYSQWRGNRTQSE